MCFWQHCQYRDKLGQFKGGWAGPDVNWKEPSGPWAAGLCKGSIRCSDQDGLVVLLTEDRWTSGLVMLLAVRPVWLPHPSRLPPPQLQQLKQFSKHLSMNSRQTCNSVTFYQPESIHTKDESKRGFAFAFIFGVNWLWRCGVTASFGVFLHDIKCNRTKNFMEFKICLYKISSLMK